MAPSSNSTLEAIGEGSIGCREADGPDVAGEDDGAAETEECNVTLGTFMVVAGVGNDLCHSTDLCLRSVGIQLVGSQLYLILFLVVFPASSGHRLEHTDLSWFPDPCCLWHSIPDSDPRQRSIQAPNCALVLSCNL